MNILEHGFLTGAVLETNVVTDFLTHDNVHLLGDTLGNGHGGQTTGLSTGNLLALESGKLVKDHKLGDPKSNNVEERVRRLQNRSIGPKKKALSVIHLLGSLS